MYILSAVKLIREHLYRNSPSHPNGHVKFVEYSRKRQGRRSQIGNFARRYQRRLATAKLCADRVFNWRRGL